MAVDGLRINDDGTKVVITVNDLSAASADTTNALYLYDIEKDKLTKIYNFAPDSYFLTCN